MNYAKPNSKNIRRCKKIFQKGIENPFSVLKAISLEYDLKSLQTYYSVHQIISDLKKDIMKNYLDDIVVFTFKFDGNGIPPNSKYLKILDGIGYTRIEKVEKDTAFYRLKSPHKYHLQGIFWYGYNIIDSYGE